MGIEADIERENSFDTHTGTLDHYDLLQVINDTAPRTFEFHVTDSHASSSYPEEAQGARVFVAGSLEITDRGGAVYHDKALLRIASYTGVLSFILFDGDWPAEASSRRTQIIPVVTRSNINSTGRRRNTAESL